MEHTKVAELKRSDSDWLKRHQTMIDDAERLLATAEGTDKGSPKIRSSRSQGDVDERPGSALASRQVGKHRPEAQIEATIDANGSMRLDAPFATIDECTTGRHLPIYS